MQQLPDPKRIWNEDKNKSIFKNRIIVTTVYVLLASIVLLGVLYYWDRKQNPEKYISKEKNIAETSSVVKEEAKTKISYEENEEIRKKNYGEFYVPLPKETPKKTELKEPLRGLYISHEIEAQPFKEENIEKYVQYIKDLYAGSSPDEASVKGINELERSIALAKATEVNSFVVDVKTDWGSLVYNSDVEAVNKLQTDNEYTDNSSLKNLIKYCKDNGIYLLARVVSFKDPVIAEKKPEHAMTLKDGGGIYRDTGGTAWVNPFDQYLWKYIVSVSKEASLLGFDEIHFDYVRFPDNAAEYNKVVDFKTDGKKLKDDNIAEFLAYARKELADYNIKTSAAIFGTTVGSWEDRPEDIGQTWRKVAENVDRVSPMMYPSHFGGGWFDLDVPDAHPYEVLQKGMIMGLERASMASNQAEASPWIQAFTASWVDGYVDYTPEMIAKQIQGSQSVGVDSYILWNAVCEYDPLIFNYKHEQNKIKEDEDISGRKVSDAIRDYFKAYEEKNFERLFMMTPIDAREYSFDEFKARMEKDYVVLNKYTYDERSALGEVDVLLSYSGKGKSVRNSKITLEAIKENGLFKIRLPKLEFEQN